MILSEKTIKELLDSKRLVIEPFDEKQIQPASVDLRISGEMLRLKGKEIVFEREQEYERCNGDEVVIPAKTHALIRSLEYVELPNDVAAMTKLVFGKTEKPFRTVEEWWNAIIEELKKRTCGMR